MRFALLLLLSSATIVCHKLGRRMMGCLSREDVGLMANNGSGADCLGYRGSVGLLRGRKGGHSGTKKKG